ncbi:hypothetical protein H072_2551 [Dactylellina haptotyla CBS 200.50]|uniref:Uncharacterized protein n=1 Tax=Dactylellina haptotyla (strain CBS 200.50) TaxID=1284197 RepID=S8AKP9_DACHA|nr:hypothetical protein H072_2551 [Dactylellina haptotyla CBS 200.50]
MAPAFWLRQTASTRPRRHSRPHRRDEENVGANNDRLYVDEKTPLLPASKSPEYTGFPSSSSSSSSSSASSPPLLPPDQNVDTPASDNTIPWRQRLRQTLLALLILSIIAPIFNTLWYGGIIPIPLPRPNPLHPPHNPTPPPIDPNLSSQTLFYGLNPGAANYYVYYLNITESLNPAHFPAGLTGNIHFLTGEEFQSHPLNIYIQLSSLTPSPFSRIHPTHTQVDLGPEHLHLSSSSRPTDDSSAPEYEHPTNVDVYIYTRPHTLQFGRGFHLSSSTFNMTFGAWAFFETYNMYLSSVAGNIHSAIRPEFLQYFTAHVMSVSTLFGNISGIWSLGSSIAFNASGAAAADKDNRGGTGGVVDIDVYPKRWSAGPWTRGDISITARRDVKMWMPFAKGTLSLRNGTVGITSLQGDIDTNLVHGALTNLTAVEGGIRARVLPFWSHSSWQPQVYPPVFETRAKKETEVNVDVPHLQLPGDLNPLEMMTGRHYSDGGDVVVRYPFGSWKGTARVESGEGTAEVVAPAGWEDRIVRDGEKAVEWRGEVGKSRVEVKATGSATFELWRPDDPSDGVTYA